MDVVKSIGFHSLDSMHWTRLHSVDVGQSMGIHPLDSLRRTGLHPFDAMKWMGSHSWHGWDPIHASPYIVYDYVPWMQ